MKPEETVDFHIRWAWAKISKLYNAEAAHYDSTMAIAYVLLSIDKEGTPATKLGPKMGMEPTGLTRILKSMEQNGLIVRVAREGDRRVVLVKLTRKGRSMRERAREKVIRFNEYLASRIPAAQLDQFFQVIQKINRIMEQDDIFGRQVKKT